MSLDPVLHPPSIAAPEDTPSVPSSPPFGAGKAFASLGLFLLAQFMVGFVVMIGAILVALASGADPNRPEFTHRVTGSTMVPLLISSAVVSIVMVYAASRLWAWPLVLDRTDRGLGVRPASRRQVALAFLAGVTVSALFVALSRWVVPYDPSTPLGPVAAAAAAGGVSRFVWTLLALVVAPFLEEFFFRGLLLKGFSASWGSVAGGVSVTVLFVALHLFETFRYWPAIVAITALAITALAARILGRGLVPAMAVHLGYNVVIVLTAYSG